MRATRLSLVATAIVAALTPTALGAPLVAVDRPCFTPGELIRVSGSGFTPSGGASLLFNLDVGHSPLDLGLATTTADASGAISVDLRAPDADRRLQQQVALGASDDQLVAGGADPDTAVGTVTFWISRFGVVAQPWMTGGAEHRGEPRRRIVFHAVGWEAAGGDTLYARYLRGARVTRDRVTGGVLARTVRLGALSGPCGDLTVTMREFPFRPVAAGDWTIDFSTSPTWPARSRLHSGYAHVFVPRSRAVR